MLGVTLFFIGVWVVAFAILYVLSLVVLAHLEVRVRRQLEREQLAIIRSGDLARLHRP